MRTAILAAFVTIFFSRFFPQYIFDIVIFRDNTSFKSYRASNRYTVENHIFFFFNGREVLEGPNRNDEKPGPCRKIPNPTRLEFRRTPVRSRSATRKRAANPVRSLGKIMRSALPVNGRRVVSVVLLMSFGECSSRAPPPHTRVTNRRSKGQRNRRMQCRKRSLRGGDFR